MYCYSYLHLKLSCVIDEPLESSPANIYREVNIESHLNFFLFFYALQEFFAQAESQHFLCRFRFWIFRLE